VILAGALAKVRPARQSSRRNPLAAVLRFLFRPMDETARARALP
jgi:hypothetical protein